MRSRRTGIIVALGALAVAVVLFVVLSGGSGSDEGKQNKVINLRLAQGQAEGGARDLTVTQGDHLGVKLHTDARAELHIHGYDLSKDVKAGKPGSILFIANDTGEFEIEAHPLVNGEEGPGVQLATLSVNP